MRTLAMWGLVGLVSAGLTSQPQQTVPAQNPPSPPPSAARDVAKPKEGTGVIRGRIVTADTGAPVRRAQVVLRTSDSPVPRNTTADVEGRYEFTRLAPGRYTVSASKSPLIERAFGQRYPSEPGTPLDLADRQTLEKIDIALVRGSVIAGRVVDDLGDPIPNFGVNVMRRVYRDGRPEFTNVVGQRPLVWTNDLGQYRAFDLPPGTYYVATERRSKPPFNDLDKGLSYPATFFPGTTNLSQAQPITVGAGEEHTNVDITIILLPMATLSGVVVDSSGRVATKAMVGVAAMSQPMGVMEGIPFVQSLQSDGRFSFKDMAPGTLSVFAEVTIPETGARETAEVPITLAGEDLKGLVLRTTPGARIAGRIESEGGVPPEVAPSRIRISATEVTPSRFSAGSGGASVRDDWSFELDGVASGARLLRVTGLPAGWAVKAVLVGEKDVTDVPTPVKGSEVLTGVRVVITNQLTEVTGTVVDAQNRPVSDYAVVVFADDESRWTPRSRFCTAVRPDHQGRYVVKGLPSGEYRAVALEFFEDGRESDPEMLGRLKPVATAFTLAEGEHRVLALKLTRDEKEPGESERSRPR